MDRLLKICDLLIYSNLLIAFCAMAMCCQTYWLLGLPIIRDTLPFMVFSSTLATYLLARIMSLRRMSGKSRARLWFRGQQNALQLLFALAALSSAALFFFQAAAVKLALVGGALVSLAYSLPAIKTPGGYVRLRDIGFLKIFLIAGTWALSTAVLPMLNAGFSLLQTRPLLLMLDRALFIFAITLPFDIRDMHYDRQKGLKTIPIAIGIKKTLRLSCFCLFVLGVLAATHQLLLPPQKHWHLFAALVVSYMLTAMLVSRTRPGNDDRFYTGLLDASMLLQFALSALAVWLDAPAK